MTEFLRDADFVLYLGDAVEVLAGLDAESVHCVVTSPPYWRLRDYGDERQLGNEPTAEAYVQRLVEVFRAVRRVLRKDGTLWLVLGDSYSSNASGARVAGINQRVLGRPGRVATQGSGDQLRPQVGRPKELVGVPWRAALALQRDGWYLRCDVVWSKPNPMPEPVLDRPTKSHEYVFLLARSRRYFYDADALREPYAYDGRRKTTHDHGAEHAHSNHAGIAGNRERWPNEGGRNVRSVWEIPTQPYPGAHFATFPEELVRRCILAGCPEGGVVLDPFLGAGTVAYVSRLHRRRCIGIELSADYADLAARRTEQLSLFGESGS